MGKLYITGIGPGDVSMITPRAMDALRASDVIVGYTAYTELIKDIFPDKEIFNTGMRDEIGRCRAAIDRASAGDTVSIICSGDAGVYGMSGLVLELLERETERVPIRDPELKSEAAAETTAETLAETGLRPQTETEIEIEIIPGITAALSGGALLGAPLMNDFCVISLSDLMTPWEVIEKRLSAVAAADLCICIYNPSSTKRRDNYLQACDILLQYRSSDAICGIAGNIGRAGEYSDICTLGDLKGKEIGMTDTLFIGNSATRIISGRMVTPRGYSI